MKSYIPDGYTAAGFIEPVPGLHEGLRFRYRPLPVPDGSEFIESLRRLKPRDAERKTADMIHAQLVDWELRSAGEPVVKNRANILRLNRALFQRLTQVVLGIEASDTDPDWPEEDQDEAADLKAQAAAEGKAPGQVAEEHAVKN